jgi:hypothetical protein
MKNNLTKNEIEVIRKIRKRGFAVIIWSPDEMGDEVNSDDMEDISIQRGWDYIADGR